MILSTRLVKKLSTTRNYTFDKPFLMTRLFAIDGVSELYIVYPDGKKQVFNESTNKWENNGRVDLYDIINCVFISSL